ncbi:UNVERIFIED_CONTAM: hypothetical protein FKN15_028357 [Acipenser sinensis]
MGRLSQDGRRWVLVSSHASAVWKGVRVCVSVCKFASVCLGINFNFIIKCKTVKERVSPSIEVKEQTKLINWLFLIIRKPKLCIYSLEQRVFSVRHQFALSSAFGV